MAKKGLGRGLQALIPEEENINPDSNQVLMIATDKISKNPDQPRKNFTKEALAELAASIKENGIIQPLLLTKEGGQYFLIAGERRLRASQLAGLKEVPCIVRDIAQVDSAALAIIENIQREGLSQLEEGEAYKKLIDSYQLTQEDLSKKLGKSRTYITNSIRLLQLPAEVKALIEAGELSGSHGRGILAVEKKYQLELANYVVKHRLNVRELENLTKDFNIEKLRGVKDKKPKDKDIHILDVERTLENNFGTKVTIKGKNKGSISLEYYSKEDLKVTNTEFLQTVLDDKKQAKEQVL